MPDEVSWELSALGHGLSTFCFSVQPDRPGAWTARADGVGTTWAIAKGAAGCCLVSGGAQNPIESDQAFGLQGGFGEVNLWEGDVFQSRLRTRAEWERDLFAQRDELAETITRVRPGGLRWNGRMSDSEVEAEYRRLRVKKVDGT